MLGSDLLVAPVTTAATSLPVYLPSLEPHPLREAPPGGRAEGAGTAWINFWTGEAVEGGQELTADAPISQARAFLPSIPLHFSPC